MYKRWQDAFAALAKTPRVLPVAKKSFILALLATALAAPYLHLLLTLVPGKRAYGPIFNILLGQSTLFFIVCLLSLLVGYGFRLRYSLPGFGSFDKWRRDFPALLAIGLILILSYQMIFGMSLDGQGRISGRENLLYLVALPLNAMFSDELILRFGLSTIAVGLCRNKTAGAALSALFAAILTEKYFGFAGIGPSSANPAVIRFGFAFCVNFLLAYLFVTRGLFHSMTLRLIIEFRYPMLVLLG